MKRFLQLFFTWWNGATFGTLLWTRRYGELVGEDQAGNRYYRTKGGAIDPSLRVERRWVIYNGVAEASAIPPEWHGWMHHIDDVPPTQETYRPHAWGETASAEPHRHAGCLSSPGSTLAPGHRPKATATTKPGCPATAGSWPVGMPRQSPFPRRIHRVNRAYPITALPAIGTSEVSISAMADVERVTRSNGPMSKFLSSFVLLSVIGASLMATPAAAQFGSIFGTEPAAATAQAVPGRQPQTTTAAAALRGAAADLAAARAAAADAAARQYPVAAFAAAARRHRRARRFDYAVAAARGRCAARTASRARRAAKQQQQPQQPADAGLPPSDEVATEPPGNKVPNPTGVFAGLDKITGRITSFDVAINETVQFGALQVTPRAAIRGRRPRRRIPTPSSRSMKSRCKGRSAASIPAGCLPRVRGCMRWSTRSTISGSPTAKAARWPKRTRAGCSAGPRATRRAPAATAAAAAATPAAAATAAATAATILISNLEYPTRRAATLRRPTAAGGAAAPRNPPGRPAPLQAPCDIAARYLGGAEGPEVIGDELRIQQREAAGAQPRHQMHQRHLGSVARVVEHALAEKRRARLTP
jgi:NADH:ubiquinone oxidoreductase subunit